ncbi:MAG: hypothetical protein ACREQI_16260, partial [Candidatus Binataceae bacterium]
CLLPQTQEAIPHVPQLHDPDPADISNVYDADIFNCSQQQSSEAEFGARTDGLRGARRLNWTWARGLLYMYPPE